MKKTILEVLRKGGLTHHELTDAVERKMACSTLRSGRYPLTIVSRASSADWPIANAEPLNVVPLGSTWISCTPRASTPAITTDAPNGRTAYMVNSCKYSERLRESVPTSTGSSYTSR